MPHIFKTQSQIAAKCQQYTGNKTSLGYIHKYKDHIHIITAPSPNPSNRGAERSCFEENPLELLEVQE